MRYMYSAEQQSSVYAKKLNILRSMQSVKLAREYLQPSLDSTNKLFIATNYFIQQCVSVLMEVPVNDIRHLRKLQAPTNARMVCWYILRKRGLSIRQIKNLYNANESMVHRKLADMDFYIEKSLYPEYNMIVDLVTTALDERVMLNYYEKTNSN